MPALKPATLVLAICGTLAALCLAPPAFGQAPASAAAAAPEPVRASAAPPLSGPPVSRDDYRIGLYDVLDINVFEIDDLHRQVQVDGSGKITLPLIGDVKALGRTPLELSDDLRQKLDAKYVNNARVEVRVRQSQSEHVTVDGAVTQPGVYDLKGPTTLLQAVAMAKGPDGPEANLHKVSIFRQVDDRWTRTQYDLDKIRHGKVEDPPIEARDVVVVAGSHKPEVLRALSAILPLALVAASL